MTSLARVPGVQNWIERLPKPMQTAFEHSWIHRAAEHMAKKPGFSIGRAIAVAVNAAKRGCATGDLNWKGPQQVNAGSKAEMCAAVTLWESMKAASGHVHKGDETEETVRAILKELAEGASTGTLGAILP